MFKHPPVTFRLLTCWHETWKLEGVSLNSPSLPPNVFLPGLLRYSAHHWSTDGSVESSSRKTAGMSQAKTWTQFHFCAFLWLPVSLSNFSLTLTCLVDRWHPHLLGSALLCCSQTLDKELAGFGDSVQYGSEMKMHVSFSVDSYFRFSPG